MLTVFICLVAAGVGTFLSLRNSGPPRIALKQFELIQVGMTYDDVKLILGREGKDIPFQLEGTLRHLKWDNEEGEGGCLVTFRNGIVFAKGQIELK